MCGLLLLLLAVVGVCRSLRSLPLSTFVTISYSRDFTFTSMQTLKRKSSTAENMSTSEVDETHK